MRLWLPTMLLFLLILSCRQEEVQPDFIPFVNVDASPLDSVLREMDLSQKLGQLLFWEIDTLSTNYQDTIRNRLAMGHFSGLLFNHIEYDSFLMFQDSLPADIGSGLWMGSKEQLLLNNQFSDAIQLPSIGSIAQIAGDSVKQQLEEIFVNQLSTLGFNWAPLVLAQKSSQQVIEHRKLKRLREAKILSPLCDLPGSALQMEGDSVQLEANTLSVFRELHREGLPAIFLDTLFFSQLQVPPAYVQPLFRKKLQYNGLIFGQYGPMSSLIDLIAAGTDVFWLSGIDPEDAVQLLEQAVKEGLLSEGEINEKVKRVWKAKQWQKEEKKETVMAMNSLSNEAAMVKAVVFEPEEELEVDTATVEEEPEVAYFKDPFWKQWRESVYLNAISVLHNPKNLIPFSYVYKRNFNLIHVGGPNVKVFDKTFGQYAGYTVRRIVQTGPDTLAALASLGRNRTYVVTLNEANYEPQRDTSFLRSLKALSLNNKLALIYYGKPEGLTAFDTSFTLIQVPDLNPTTEKLTAELLFGAVTVHGRLPETINPFLQAGAGINLPKVRLQYNEPTSVGISPEKLVGIDAIANTAIAEGIIPGCQVLVAKSGKVIYKKSFGHHTFSKRRRVRNDHLYDIASLTKIVGTTLATMQLYDKGKFKLNNTLSELGIVAKSSTLSKVQVRKILTHESGLQPFMPVIPFLLHRDQGNAACDSFFCKTPTEEYTIQVADSFFFKGNYIDSIWAAVDELPLKRAGRYRYSDVNFMLMQRLVEKISGKKLDEYLKTELYQPLGLQHITYQPLQQFKLEQIVPTERDKRWRQRLVHGYVHDETAALFGGVGGHAGLFSNSDNLAIISQLLLDKGSYGGRQFINPETIKQFTKSQYGTHRGLGFDTADPRSRSAFSRVVPTETFGHTGFTGTCLWVDPENDIVYVFLSNRLHPSAKNRRFLRRKIRERIQEVVYDALGSEDELWPDLALLDSKKQ